MIISARQAELLQALDPYNIKEAIVRVFGADVMGAVGLLFIHGYRLFNETAYTAYDVVGW